MASCAQSILFHDKFNNNPRAIRSALFRCFSTFNSEENYCDLNTRYSDTHCRSPRRTIGRGSVLTLVSALVAIHLRVRFYKLYVRRSDTIGKIYKIITSAILLYCYCLLHKLRLPLLSPEKAFARPSKRYLPLSLPLSVCVLISVALAQTHGSLVAVAAYAHGGKVAAKE